MWNILYKYPVFLLKVRLYISNNFKEQEQKDILLWNMLENYYKSM